MVSEFCAVCGSHGGRVVRQALVSNCHDATHGRVLALRDVLLVFLPGSKRTVHLHRVPGEGFRAYSGPCRTRAHCFPDSPSSLSVSSVT